MNELIEKIKLRGELQIEVARGLVKLFEKGDLREVRRMRNIHLKQLKKQFPEENFNKLIPRANKNMYFSAILGDLIQENGNEILGQLYRVSFILERDNTNPGKISKFFEEAIGYKPTYEKLLID